MTVVQQPMDNVQLDEMGDDTLQDIADSVTSEDMDIKSPKPLALSQSRHHEEYSSPTEDKKGEKDSYVYAQTFVTLVFFPMACLWYITVMTDIMVSTPWTQMGERIVLLALPSASYAFSVYMLVSFWMDPESWTMLRRRVSFANIPMTIYFGVVLMGQSSNHKMGLSCPQRAFILQIMYLTMNTWHTLTIYSAYQFIVKDQKGFHKSSFLGIRKSAWSHIICWLAPWVCMGIMALLGIIFDIHVFDQDLPCNKDDSCSDLNAGRGFTGYGCTDSIRGENRVVKAIFINTPQLIAVSFYAQFFYYIQAEIDPVDDGMVSSHKAGAKISTSRNAALQNSSAALLHLRKHKTASQIRLYMAAYMVSFLTNTVVQLVSDNMYTGQPSRQNMLFQGCLVMTQGILWGIVFLRASTNNLFSLYMKAFGLCGDKEKNNAGLDISEEGEEGSAPEVKKSAAQVAQGHLGCLSNTILIVWQTLMCMPVAIWVWVPMEFLLEVTKDTGQILLSLIIWGCTTMFPFYFFSILALQTNFEQTGADWADMNFHFEVGRHVFYMFVIGISLLAVISNAYNPDLLLIEGPVRSQGAGGKAFIGFRMNSARNLSTAFSLIVEFFQIAHLSWTASRMDDHYNSFENLNSTQVGNVTRMYIAPTVRGVIPDNLPDATVSLAKYYLSIVAIVIWGVLYSLPAVVVNTTTGNRTLSTEMVEYYRLFLWGMSGPAFLTVLKSLTFAMFCTNDMDGDGTSDGEYYGVLTDKNIECWTPPHLRMVAFALLGLCVFFPSASLTTLFRYDEDDQRGLPPFIVAGGSDMRYLHMWRRVEYMVKGIWVYSGITFMRFGNWACISILLGSVLISFMSTFIGPCNLPYFNRWKWVIYTCNSWTTLTCLLARLSDNHKFGAHVAIMVSGWVVLIIALLVYNAKDPFNKLFYAEVGDETNIELAKVAIVKSQDKLLHTRGIMKWGSHMEVENLLRLAHHPDATIQRDALAAMAFLAYQDVMTKERSFFLNNMPVDPGVALLMGIVLDEDSDAVTRNSACRTMAICLQSNVGNRFMKPVTYHSELQELDDRLGGIISERIATYAIQCEDQGHQVDAMLLCQYMCHADSNDLVGVADKAMPYLANAVTNGNVIQQLQAVDIIAMISSRFDLCSKVINKGCLKELMDLFHVVVAQYGEFETPTSVDEVGDGSTVGFREGEKILSSQRYDGHHLPSHHRDGFQLDAIASPGPADDVGAERFQVVSTSMLRAFQEEILRDVITIIAELAAGSLGGGRKAIIDAGALDVIKACLHFHEGNAADQELHDVLQLEACRAVHALMSDKFGMNDIHADTDFNKYYGILCRYKADIEARAEGEDGMPVPEEELDELQAYAFDKGMSALQRKKAHIIAAVLRLDHESIGSRRTRTVLVTHPIVSAREEAADTIIMNPILSPRSQQLEQMFKSTEPSKKEAATKAGGGTTEEAKPETTEVVGDLYDWNRKQIEEAGITDQLLELKDTQNFELRFLVVDVLVIMLEHDCVKVDILPEVKTVMMRALGSRDHGMAVIGATGMNVFASKENTYRKYGERKAALGANIKLFRWGGSMVRWIVFWKLRSKKVAYDV